MELPTEEFFAKQPPQATFRYIAAWAADAADIYEEIESEYDQASERATALRLRLIDCSAMIFAAIVRGNADAKWRLARGLDKAQWLDKLTEPEEPAETAPHTPPPS